MSVNPNYERDISFDIDAYLIESYPTMTMAIRRSVCALSFQWFDPELLEEMVDAVVAQYAMEQLNITKKEEEDDS